METFSIFRVRRWASAQPGFERYPTSAESGRRNVKLLTSGLAAVFARLGAVAGFFRVSVLAVFVLVVAFDATDFGVGAPRLERPSRRFQGNGNGFAGSQVGGGGRSKFDAVGQMSSTRTPVSGSGPTFSTAPVKELVCAS